MNPSWLRIIAAFGTWDWYAKYSIYLAPRVKKNQTTGPNGKCEPPASRLLHIGLQIRFSTCQWRNWSRNFTSWLWILDFLKTSFSVPCFQWDSFRPVGSSAEMAISRARFFHFLFLPLVASRCILFIVVFKIIGFESRNSCEQFLESFLEVVPELGELFGRNLRDTVVDCKFPTNIYFLLVLQSLTFFGAQRHCVMY